MGAFDDAVAKRDPAVYQRAIKTVENNRPLSNFFKTMTPATVTAILSGESQSRKNAGHEIY